MPDAVTPKSSVEKLEIEEHEDVPDLGRQMLDEVASLASVWKFRQVLDGEVDLLEASRHGIAQAVGILTEGFGNRAGVEEQMDAPHSDFEDLIGVHSVAPRYLALRQNPGDG